MAPYPFVRKWRRANSSKESRHCIWPRHLHMAHDMKQKNKNKLHHKLRRWNDHPINRFCGLELSQTIPLNMHPQKKKKNSADASRACPLPFQICKQSTRTIHLTLVRRHRSQSLVDLVHGKATRGRWATELPCGKPNIEPEFANEKRFR